MATAEGIVSLANSWVGKKITDPTNKFGGQCTTLINQLMKQTTDNAYNLNWTNAKDGLAKAAAQGLTVIYNDPNNPDLIPEPGDFVVCYLGVGDDFGHILVCVSADRNGMTTIEQNIDGWRDENGDGINDQLQEGGGGYTRNHWRNYEGVIGWFRLPYDENKKEEEENDMITISAPGRGIALLMGGKFLPILHKDTPPNFWSQGVKHFNLDTATFDAWQGKAEKSTLDDATVNKLITGFKK